MKLKTRDELVSISESLRKDGKKIGFTSGSFDILHAGHVDYLKKAKEKCDVLIVGVNSDKSVKSYKGEERPLVPEDERINIIAGLGSVDYAFLFDEGRNKKNIELLKPHYYIKAGDYKESELTSKEIVEKHGGEAVLIPIEKDISTTKLINKITETYGGKDKFIEKDKAVHISLKSNKKQRAIFLDRDGTINEDVEYLHEPEKFKLLPNVVEGLKKMQDMGFRLVVVTNQVGIGLGYFTKEDFYKINQKMFLDISPQGINIEKIYFCPHTRGENCDCKKPGTALFERAKEDLNLDLKRSYIIGDKTSDIEVGRRMGLKTIRVKTGHNESEYDVNPDYIAEDLLDAANYILEEDRK